MFSNRVRWRYYASTHRSGGWPLQKEALKHPPRDPDHATVLPDLDPELDGLPLRVPVGVLGEGEKHSRRLIARGSDCVL
jgi:hypothetical protein